jgi:hypothetical protein
VHAATVWPELPASACPRFMPICSAVVVGPLSETSDRSPRRAAPNYTELRQDRVREASHDSRDLFAGFALPDRLSSRRFIPAGRSCSPDCLRSSACSTRRASMGAARRIAGFEVGTLRQAAVSPIAVTSPGGPRRSELKSIRRIDEKKLPDCAGFSSACKGRIAGLCNPLRNTAGGRKDEQAGNFF